MRKDYSKTLYIIPYALYLVFFLFSCGQEEKTIVIPSDILPKEKMAQVITDIHIAEAETNLKTFPDTTSTEKLSFEKIFAKNKISQAQYDTSISFYIDHPKLLKEVYEEALNELSKMQAGKE